MSMTLKRLTIATTALLTVGCRFEPAGSSWVIAGANVIDVRDGSVLRDVSIVVDSGRIRSVGPRNQVSTPRGAHVVDATGKFVIPGLWDMHTHIQNARELEVFFPLLVAHGILGIRDCEGLFPPAFQALSEKLPYRPHVFASGAAVEGTAPPGTDDAAIVDELAAKGSDFIKVFSLVPRARFHAVLRRAKEHNLHVAGHVPISVPATEASDSGLRTMEHFDEILVNVSTRETELRAQRLSTVSRYPEFVDQVWELAFPPITPYLRTWSDAKASALFATLKRNGTWQVPTLELYRKWTLALWNDSTFWSNPSLQLVPVDWRDSWRGENSVFLKGKTGVERAALRQRTRDWYESQVDIARRMHKAGVKFLAGTDAAQWNFMVPGLSLHDELVRFVEVGLTPLEALQAATMHPAEYLGLADAGVVEPGRRADLLILDADPTVDISNTRRIHAVVLGGRLIERPALDTMLRSSIAAASVPPGPGSY